MTAPYTSRRGIVVPPAEFAKAGVMFVSGWSIPEPTGIWTVGPEAVMTIPRRAQKGPFRVTLKGMVFGDGETPQEVRLFDQAGRSLGVMSSLAGEVSTTVEIDPAAQPTADPMMIRAKISRPLSPRAVGKGNDDRLLGFGLTGLRFDARP